MEVALGRRGIETINLDEATSQLELVSSAHQQVLANPRKANQHETRSHKVKHGAKSIFLSATPAPYELELSQQVVEQIIRPTGLLDPITYVYPKS